MHVGVVASRNTHTPNRTGSVPNAMTVTDYGAQCPCCGEENPGCTGTLQGFELHCCGALVPAGEEGVYCGDGRHIKSLREE